MTKYYRYNHSTKGKVRTAKYERTPTARARQKRYRSSAAYREHDKFRQHSYRSRDKLRAEAL